MSEGDFASALRLADRAWRLAPGTAEIGELYARLLLAEGEAGKALGLLTALAARRRGPDIEALVIEALLTVGRAEAAAGRLSAALQAFAVAPSDPLARAANSVLMSKSANGAAGWCGLSPGLQIVGDVLGFEKTALLQVANSHGDKLLSKKIGDARSTPGGFKLPRLDSSSAKSLSVTVNAVPLLGSALPYPPRFGLDGRAVARKKRIDGWARIAWSPRTAPDLIVQDERDGRRALPIEGDAIQPDRWRFAFDPPKAGLKGSRIVISARLPDGSIEALPDAPLLLEPAIRELRKVRRRTRHAPLMPASIARPDLRPVDVLIPIHGNSEESRACLESVLATVGRSTEVIVVDDASPEPDLRRMLDRLAAEGRISLLRNEDNRGFPAAANRGLAQNATHDVVLLNSDTVVAGDWLERLRKAAYSAPDIGTVTPLSNFGSIASYPSGDSIDCTTEEAANIDRQAAIANAGIALEIPAGVGFCLFLRRDCLAAVGQFDEATFQKGYGEETDFCLRAAARGWRHLLAGDVYVRHVGGGSFGHRRQALLERAGRILNGLHPGYDALIRKFEAADLVAPLRRRLDEARLKQLGARHVLMLTLDLPGGVDRLIADRCLGLRRSGLIPLILRPTGELDPSCRLSTDDGAFRDLIYEIPGDLSALKTLLGALAFEHLEFHHFLHHDERVIELVRSLKAPLDVYLHDYGWICPRFTLIGGEGTYCGEPSLKACESCIVKNGSMLPQDLTVKKLRRRSRRWLVAARSIIAPSRDASLRLQRYFPGLKVEVEPWEKKVARGVALPARAQIFRIAVIGAIGLSKGYDLVLACARDAARRRLPLEFVILGHTDNADEPLLKTGKAFVTGRYRESEIADLIRRERPRLAWFPSVWPETWCFALSHAIRAGLSILAFDLGAFSERLRGLRDAKLVPLETNPRIMNDILLETARARSGQAQDQTGETARLNADGAVAMLPTHERALAPAARARRRSKDMQVLMETSDEGTKDRPTVSIQLLRLPEGLHAFMVRTGTPAKASLDSSLMLPALHVGVGPGASQGTIEFISDANVKNNWLCDAGDVVIARIAGGPASVLLTSLRTPATAALNIEIQRVDGRSFQGLQPQNLELASVGDNPPAGQIAATGLRKKLVAHIQRRGDVSFIDQPWAGFAGQRLWMESFSIEPLEKIANNEIEYKGLTATGFETPWLSGGAACGTRGMSVPLVGFSIRMKPSARASKYDCEYSGAFLSGARVGPLRNGEPCRSTRPSDPLEAIQLRIVERRSEITGTNAGAKPAEPAKIAGKPGAKRVTAAEARSVAAKTAASKPTRRTKKPIPSAKVKGKKKG